VDGPVDIGYLPLSAHAYPCSHKSDKDGMLDGYKSPNAQCTFCDEICQKPKVDDSIGFLDGFDYFSVGISYAVLIPISIIMEIVICIFLRPKWKKELEELK